MHESDVGEALKLTRCNSLLGVGGFVSERLLMTLEGLGAVRSRTGARGGSRWIQKEGGLGIQFDRAYYCRLCKEALLVEKMAGAVNRDVRMLWLYC